MGSKVHSKYSTLFLAAMFFVEAIFFLPTDPLLILYCVERRHKAMFYGLVATVSSVIGGIAGYFIGLTVWETAGRKIISLFVTQGAFEEACAIYEHYEKYAVLVAGFSPLPYKAVTLTAGFCRLPLITFVICSLIARGARFMLVATVISIWGKKIKKYIDRYFNQLVVLFVLIIAGSCFLFKT